MLCYLLVNALCFVFFFFKQKTAYEMRISDWSSDVCSSDLNENVPPNEWQIDASDDKVRISVSPGLKERIASARNSKENRAILINSIYFGAVVQCLSFLRMNDEIGDQRCPRQYYRAPDGVEIGRASFWASVCKYV